MLFPFPLKIHIWRKMSDKRNAISEKNILHGHLRKNDGKKGHLTKHYVKKIKLIALILVNKKMSLKLPLRNIKIAF